MSDGTGTLLIAALSLILSGLSLGWQIAQWLLSAGRAKATLMHGMMQGPGAYVGAVGKTGKGFDLKNLKRQGIDGVEVIGIQVTNHGRSPVAVEAVSVSPLGGSMQFLPAGQCVGPDFTHVIEPGTNASWYVPADRAIALAEASRQVAHEDVKAVYMTATLGTGKTVRTPRSFQA